MNSLLVHNEEAVLHIFYGFWYAFPCKTENAVKRRKIVEKLSKNLLTNRDESGMIARLSRRTVRAGLGTAHRKYDRFHRQVK